MKYRYPIDIWEEDIISFIIDFALCYNNHNIYNIDINYKN